VNHLITEYVCIFIFVQLIGFNVLRKGNKGAVVSRDSVFQFFFVSAMLLPSVRSVKPLQHRTGVSFSRANIVNRVSSYNTRRSVTSLRVSQPERIAKNPVLTSTTNTKLFFQTTKYIQKRYNSEGTDDYMYTIDTPGSNQRTGDEEYTKKKKKKRFGDGRVVHIPFSTTPKGLSSILGISTVEVLKTMIRLGERPTSSNETILGDLADLIAAELRFTPV
jgi:hypothetical protein